MALNKEVFRTRTQTAVIYALVMLAGLLWNEWSFFILFSIVHFGAWYEFRKLAERIGSTSSKQSTVLPVTLAFLGWGMMMAANAESLDISGYHVSEVGWRLMRISIGILLVEMYRTKAFNRKNIIWSLTGLAYLSLPLALLVNLRSGWIWGQTHESSFLSNALSGFNGKIICILLVIGIWINDTMAYIVGSLIGKTPLTSWSPNKTWEGTIGGIILSCGLIILIAYWQFETSWALLIISVVNAISGTFGDLVESKLKRMAGVKDSGTFLPGHGGFLDRFDSIILAAPAVWIMCYLLFR